MVPLINKTDYSSYRVPFIDEFIPGFEYEYVHFSIIKQLDYRVGEMYRLKSDDRLEFTVTDVRKDTVDGIVDCRKPNHCNPEFQKVLPLKTIGYSKGLLENPCKVITNYWTRGKIGSPFCMAWGGDVLGNPEMKKRFEEKLAKGEIITRSKLLSYHKQNKHNAYDWITVNYPWKKHHCESVILRSKPSKRKQVEKEVKLLNEEEKPILNKFTGKYIRKEYSFSYVKREEYEGYVIQYLWKNSSDKNLEAKPMKSKRTRKTFEVLVKPKGGKQFTLRVTGDVDLQITKEGKFYNTEPIYNKVKGMNPKAKVIVMKEVDDIITRLKKNYKPPKTKQYKICVAMDGYAESGYPRGQLSKEIYGPSVKSALRKHKIKFSDLLWVKQNNGGVDSLPGTEEYVTLYERKLPVSNLTKAEKRRLKAKRKREARKQHVKEVHAWQRTCSDRMVCVRFKDTQDIRRVWKSELGSPDYPMDEWHYVSKSKYKELKGKAKKITQPKEIKVDISNTVSRHKNNKVQVDITYNKGKQGSDIKGKAFRFNEETQGKIDEAKSLRKKVIWRINDNSLTWAYLKKVRKLKKINPEEYEKLIKSYLKDGKLDIIIKNPENIIRLKESTVAFTKETERIDPPEMNTIKRLEESNRAIDEKTNKLKEKIERRKECEMSMRKKGYYSFHTTPTGKEVIVHHKGERAKAKSNKFKSTAAVQSRKARTAENRLKRQAAKEARIRKNEANKGTNPWKKKKE